MELVQQGWAQFVDRFQWKNGDWIEGNQFESSSRDFWMNFREFLGYLGLWTLIDPFFGKLFLAHALSPKDLLAHRGTICGADLLLDD